MPASDLRIALQPSSSPAEWLAVLAQTRLKLDRTLQVIAAGVEKDLSLVARQANGTLVDVRQLAGTLLLDVPAQDNPFRPTSTPPAAPATPTASSAPPSAERHPPQP